MQKFKTVDELINQLKPEKPIYCIRKKSIQLASTYFKKKFPGKVLYAVKTNHIREVLKTIVESGIENF
jgi:ornithine decarboxylase